VNWASLACKEEFFAGIRFSPSLLFIVSYPGTKIGYTKTTVNGGVFPSFAPFRVWRKESLFRMEDACEGTKRKTVRVRILPFREGTPGSARRRTRSLP